MLLESLFPQSPYPIPNPSMPSAALVPVVYYFSLACKWLVIIHIIAITSAKNQEFSQYSLPEEFSASSRKKVDE